MPFFTAVQRCALLFVSSLPRTKTMPGLCLWAGTRAALTLREQLAAPSNIHERDGKTVKDSIDPGIQNGRQSVCSQRLMGLICVKSGRLLSVRDIVFVCEVVWGELQSCSCHQWRFCSDQSVATGQISSSAQQLAARFSYIHTIQSRTVSVEK